MGQREDSPMRKAALAYAERGIVVLPIPPLGKEAREKGHYCTCTGGEPLIGSTDPDWINARWQREPRLNIGVVTGQRSQLLIIDVDVKENGDEHLRKWINEHRIAGRELPPHATVATPTGGRHHWFRLPVNAGHVKTVIGWLPGVDVKACGGYVAAAPSVRAITVQTLAGDSVVEDQELRAYAWELGAGGLPDTPDWLLADIKVRREGTFTMPNGKKLRDGEMPSTSYFLEHGWPAGRRNEWMFRTACRLWMKLGDHASNDVQKILRQIWERTDQSGFPWDEVEYGAFSARNRMRQARETEHELVQKYMNAWKGPWDG